MYEHMQNGTGPDLEAANTDIDRQIEETLREFEETPLLVRKLTSHNLDDLKGLSEIPRRLVFHLVSLDAIIEARDNLRERMWESAQYEIERAEQDIERADEMLEDSIKENDAEAVKIKRKAILRKRKMLNRMRIAAALHTSGHSLLKRFRLSFLEYQQGVERKGRTEFVEALQAVMMSEQQGETVEAP